MRTSDWTTSIQRLPLGTAVHCFAPYDPWRQITDEDDRRRPSAFELVTWAVQEMGFIGVCVALVLFLALLLRCTRIATRATDAFSSLAARWGWLSDGQYAHVAAMVSEIGRLLGGWQKVTHA